MYDGSALQIDVSEKLTFPTNVSTPFGTNPTFPRMGTRWRQRLTGFLLANGLA